MPVGLHHHQPQNVPLNQRTVTTNTPAVAADDVIYADADAAAFTVNIVNAADRTRPLTIKRIDNNHDHRVVIRDDTHGIDGSHGNDITLAVTTAFGVESGEGVTLIFDPDGDTWRVS